MVKQETSRMEGSSDGRAWEDVDYSSSDCYPKQVTVDEERCIRAPIGIRHVEPRQNAGDAGYNFMSALKIKATLYIFFKITLTELAILRQAFD